MRKTLLATAFAVFLCCGAAVAQTGVTAGNFNSYMVDQPAATGTGLTSPIPASSITDAVITMNVQAFPIADSPVAMIIDRGPVLGGTIQINALSFGSLQIDLRDKGNNGYSEQILFCGFSSPVSLATHTGGGGAFSATTGIPACAQNTNGVTICITNSIFDQFEIGSQALVVDPTKIPLGLETTPAVQGLFDNGYKQFMLSGESNGVFTFKQGFVFKYYGLSFTQANLSANGFVSFGQVDTGFPSPTVSSIRTGVRRILSFYNDLVPEQLNATGTGPAYALTRIYAQQFKDVNGLTKVKFVHDHLAEFSNTTGPHGGEIIITDNDDIAVFLPGYNGVPSINTAVGITPGNSVDNNVPTFGENLSQRFGTLYTPPSLGDSAYEVFDHGPPAGVLNPIDLIGFANNPTHPVGPGIVFLKDTNVPNTTPTNSRYIIQ
ncbi:MAG: hypothetical protein ACI97A_000763 [Planctomycetota bacterium]|jgi:hypothetical protein